MSNVPLENETDARRLFEEMQVREQDAQLERAKHEQQWRDNHKLVLGDHAGVFKAGKHHYFTANRIRHIIDTHTAIITETPPRIGFEPSEVGEPPDWFLKPEAAEKLQMVPGHGLADEQVMGEVPIADEVAQALLAFTIDQPQQVADEMGNAMVVMQPVPVFTEDDFIIVTDQVAADALTQEVEAQSQIANAEQTFIENVFDTQVIGHEDTLVQWDASENRFTLTNLYPFNCWIDPWARDTANAEYYILREFLPVSEAKAMFPELAEYIERVATTSASTSSQTYNIGSKHYGNGTRKVVEVRTWWQRNHPYDVDVDEALEKGFVEPAMQEVEQETLDETGQPVIVPVEQPVVTDAGEQVYRLAGSDALVMPGDPDWPKRSGIRQIQFVRDRLVYDDETEFADIPVARNKCMFIPHSPNAQGEPQRIAELNDLYNRLWSIYHDYFKYFRSPEQAIPESVYNATKDAVETLHASASKKWIIPDGRWMQFNGDVIKNLSPPQLGSVVSEMMRVVEQAMDKVAGMSDVLRGEAKSEWSNALFENATNAARGPIGLKARSTANYLKHIGKIVANLIIDFMPPEEWAKRNRKYPPQVLAAMKQRIRRVGFNVVVEVSGSGTREEKIRTEMELWNAGVQTPTLLRTILENRGVADALAISQEWEARTAGMPQLPPQ